MAEGRPSPIGQSTPSMLPSPLPPFPLLKLCILLFPELALFIFVCFCSVLSVSGMCPPLHLLRVHEPHGPRGRLLRRPRGPVARPDLHLLRFRRPGRPSGQVVPALRRTGWARTRLESRDWIWSFLFQACSPRYVWFSYNLKRREPIGTCLTADAAFGDVRKYSPCQTSEPGLPLPKETEVLILNYPQTEREREVWGK